MKKFLLTPSAGRTKTLLFVPAAGMLVFAVLTAFSRPPGFFDESVFAFIAPHITEGRTRFLKFITFYGNHAFLLPANILVVLYFVWRKKRRLAITVAAVALSSYGVMNLLKVLTQRHRPPDPMISGITNYSFPSGHAFMSVAFYGLLVWLVVKYEPVKWKQYLFSSLLVLFTLLIGFSRIYLRVHYASDVIAGFSIGLIWLMLVLALTQRWLNPVQELRKKDQGL